jgi:hypothetical protein
MSFVQNAERAAQSFGSGEQGGQAPQQQQSGGGGIDNAVNKGALAGSEGSVAGRGLTRCAEVDQFATKEGVPQAADGVINKEVDQEVNKFT